MSHPPALVPSGDLCQPADGVASEIADHALDRLGAELAAVAEVAGAGDAKSSKSARQPSNGFGTHGG